MVNTLDLIDIFHRTVHLKMAEYTFFSAYGTFTKNDHILGHKSKFQGPKLCRAHWETDHSRTKQEIKKQNDNQ